MKFKSNKIMSEPNSDVNDDKEPSKNSQSDILVTDQNDDNEPMKPLSIKKEKHSEYQSATETEQEPKQPIINVNASLHNTTTEKTVEAEITLLPPQIEVPKQVLPTMKKPTANPYFEKPIDSRPQSEQSSSNITHQITEPPSGIYKSMAPIVNVTGLISNDGHKQSERNLKETIALFDERYKSINWEQYPVKSETAYNSKESKLDTAMDMLNTGKLDNVLNQVKSSVDQTKQIINHIELRRESRPFEK